MRKLTRKEVTGKLSRREKKVNAKLHSSYYDFRNMKVHPIPGTADRGVTPTKWLLKWAKLWGRGRNAGHYRVGFDVVGTVEVSTVFLGLNHNCSPHTGRPLLFETMTFPGNRMWRYCTVKDALRGHREVVAKLRGK